VAEVQLPPRVRSDIDAIWDYTVATWSVQQARHHLNGLSDVCMDLADSPELGNCRDELYEGLRVYPSGRHLVFYLIMDKGIDVVRILHGSMDFELHL
jgi:toxin ParE1/3/4